MYIRKIITVNLINEYNTIIICTHPYTLSWMHAVIWYLHIYSTGSTHACTDIHCKCTQFTCYIHTLHTQKYTYIHVDPHIYMNTYDALYLWNWKHTCICTHKIPVNKRVHYSSYLLNITHSFKLLNAMAQVTTNRIITIVFVKIPNDIYRATYILLVGNIQ